MAAYQRFDDYAVHAYTINLMHCMYVFMLLILFVLYIFIYKQQKSSKTHTYICIIMTFYRYILQIYSIQYSFGRYIFDNITLKNTKIQKNYFSNRNLLWNMDTIIIINFEFSILVCMLFTFFAFIAVCGTVMMTEQTLLTSNSVHQHFPSIWQMLFQQTFQKTSYMNCCFKLQ